MPVVLTEKPVPLVALVGNPNAGKTTVFNAITGAHQKVGNYPGVTVERVSALLDLGDGYAEFVDVPGVYSLDPVSEDERVATEVIKGTSRQERPPDLFVVVLDATNLERNLFLLSHVRDLGTPSVVALTMTDMPMPLGERSTWGIWNPRSECLSSP